MPIPNPEPANRVPQKASETETAAGRKARARESLSSLQGTLKAHYFISASTIIMTTTEPDNKKLKMDDYPMSPDEEWPEAWLMPDYVNDQCQPNQLEPHVPVSAEQMRELGMCYWKMHDVDKYEYPTKAVPWDPKDAKDPKLQALRDARGYSYADIITVHPDHLPEFDTKIAAFFEEHIHDAVSRLELPVQC